VFVGDNSGTLRCVDAATGAPVWTANTGAEILTEPLVAGDRVIVGNGDGLVAAFSTKDGRRLWSFRAGAAVYSSPVLAGGAVVFGDLSGALHAVDLRTGRPLWVNRDAEYSIESKPATDGERVWFGAWDQYVRCVDARTGKLIWKELCEGSRTATAAKRYYSAADATPHLAGGKLFIADRKYVLTVYDASSGRVLSSREGVAATGVSEDGKAIYLRQVSGELVKMDTEGNVLWSVDAGLNAVPAAPVEKSGVVYVCSAGGTVSAISARYGEVLWRYQASPGLFVMSSVASDGTVAFVSTFGGRLTAVSRK
jgi:outer membrane protein assembly factor BamB